MKHQHVQAAFLLAISLSLQAAASVNAATLIDFEGENPLAGNNLTHKAKTSVVTDVPENGGKFAAKTKIDSAAGAETFFGTGFKSPITDLSSSSIIGIWIKTDIKSQFNIQLHSVDGGTGIFPISTADSTGKWKKFTAPLKSFRKPQWANRNVNLKRINKVQLTAFGSGPYDGKYVILDHLTVDGNNLTQVESPRPRKPRPVREPVILKRGEAVDMFDGKTLKGWFTTPRVYVPRGEKFAKTPSDQLYDAVIKHYEESDTAMNRIPNRERVKNKGVWKVEDGAVIGGQVPGSTAGAYLMSEKTYGDFELTLEANPDYPIDTGIMVRAHKLGSVGFQVLVDMRPNGTVGGVYGNSVGGFFAYPFVFDADEKPLNKIANIRPGDPDGMKFSGGQFQTDQAASLNDFLKAWNLNDWNEIKIRCTGRLPLIETWINGVPIAKIDTATLAEIVPNYDPDAIYRRIGRKGHIGLEVHDSPTRDRWAPGAVARWRNLKIRELEIKE